MRLQDKLLNHPHRIGLDANSPQPCLWGVPQAGRATARMALVSSSVSVLDVGCGTGQYAKRGFSALLRN
jgi:2-polyprenyl-3-methyl-5-hydroxy-6-metoxy-1,4-benzoquinol methylase